MFCPKMITEPCSDAWILEMQYSLDSNLPSSIFSYISDDDTSLLDMCKPYDGGEICFNITSISTSSTSTRANVVMTSSSSMTATTTYSFGQVSSESAEPCGDTGNAIYDCSRPMLGPHWNLPQMSMTRSVLDGIDWVSDCFVQTVDGVSTTIYCPLLTIDTCSTPFDGALTSFLGFDLDVAFSVDDDSFDGHESNFDTGITASVNGNLNDRVATYTVSLNYNDLESVSDTLTANFPVCGGACGEDDGIDDEDSTPTGGMCDQGWYQLFSGDCTWTVEDNCLVDNVDQSYVCTDVTTYDCSDTWEFLLRVDLEGLLFVGQYQLFTADQTDVESCFEVAPVDGQDCIGCVEFANTTMVEATLTSDVTYVLRCGLNDTIGVIPLGRLTFEGAACNANEYSYQVCDWDLQFASIVSEVIFTPDEFESEEMITWSVDETTKLGCFYLEDFGTAFCPRVEKGTCGQSLTARIDPVVGLDYSIELNADSSYSEDCIRMAWGNLCAYAYDVNVDVNHVDYKLGMYAIRNSMTAANVTVEDGFSYDFPKCGRADCSTDWSDYWWVWFLAIPAVVIIVVVVVIIVIIVLVVVKRGNLSSFLKPTSTVEPYDKYSVNEEEAYDE